FSSPQSGPPGDTCRRRNDTSPRRETECDAARIATADIEMINIGQILDGLQHALGALVPRLDPNIQIGGMAHVLLVIAAFHRTMPSEFEAENRRAVDEERAAHACSKRQDALASRSLRDAEAVDDRIVKRSHGGMQSMTECAFEIEFIPMMCAEIGGRLNVLPADDAGKADRYAAERWKGSRDIC